MSFAPVITPTGIIAPTFADILTALQAQMRSIFGSDLYLDPDSQDGQMLAIFATAIKDNNDSIIAAYNAFSPASAQGVGLSSVVKINGIRRLISSNSQVVQRVTGAAGTQVLNGQVCDPNNTAVVWALPTPTVIPNAGFIDVTATCQTAGAVAAGTGTLTRIVTPTRGWQSTTNTADATPGAPVENDSTLRQRQSVSTAIPALSVLDAILGAIKNLIGVGRAFIYENDTGAADGNGIPAHSISAVVEGGDITTIGETIARYKTPGTGTYGTTSVDVVDGVGVPNTINFYELTLIDIAVLVNVTAEAGYVGSTGDLIRAALVQWFNGLIIGQDAQLNKLWSPVNLTGDTATGTSGQTQAQLDILSNTYNATAIYQARTDKMVLTAQTVAGAATFTLSDVSNYANGKTVVVVLDNGSFLTSVVTNVNGGTKVVTVADNVPAGRTANVGALVYVAGDIVVAFNEAVAGLLANMTVDAA